MIKIAGKTTLALALAVLAAPRPQVLRDDAWGPLFHTIGRGTGAHHGALLAQANAYAMIQRRMAATVENRYLRSCAYEALGNHHLRQWP